MFAITADQINSRHTPDHGDDAVALLTRAVGDKLALPPDRTAGDEVQALTAHADAALDAVLALARTGAWSIGLGIGTIVTPLPSSTRTASGGALVAARTAVDTAKKRPLHVAIEAERAIRPGAATLQAMIDLLLQLRARRSPEGWELYELLESGLTQADAASRLGITPQAASKRAIAGGIRLDLAARDGLVDLLELADPPESGDTP